MKLQGEKVVLRPMKTDEISLFYDWATKSDGSRYWYGELAGGKAPTYEEFTQGWKRHYFDGSKPEKGRCFVILAHERAIGQVNYNAISRENHSVELDIIIAAEEDKNKGYGSDALKTLVEYLFKDMNVSRCWIEPGDYNRRAIRAYEKAGFRKVTSYVKNDRTLVLLEVKKADAQNY